MSEIGKQFKNSYLDIILGQAFLPTLALIIILSISKWAIPTFYALIVTTSLIVWAVVIAQLKLAVVSNIGVQIKTLVSCKKYDFCDIESVCSANDGFMGTARCCLLLNDEKRRRRKTWFPMSLKTETDQTPEEMFNFAFMKKEGEIVGFIREKIARNCGISCDVHCALSDVCDVIANRTIQRRMDGKKD